ncbi:hypothetical protein MY3957_001517 [Beauveria namnaoensis]
MTGGPPPIVSTSVVAVGCLVTGAELLLGTGTVSIPGIWLLLALLAVFSTSWPGSDERKDTALSEDIESVVMLGEKDDEEEEEESEEEEEEEEEEKERDVEAETLDAWGNSSLVYAGGWEDCDTECLVETVLDVVEDGDVLVVLDEEEVEQTLSASLELLTDSGDVVEAVEVIVEEFVEVAEDEAKVVEQDVLEVFNEDIADEPDLEIDETIAEETDVVSQLELELVSDSEAVVVSRVLQEDASEVEDELHADEELVVYEFDVDGRDVGFADIPAASPESSHDEEVAF